MINDEQISIPEIWNILRRRRYLFGLPAAGIFIATVFYVFSIPAVYRSEATILIEDQEMPEDIVGATIANYASQQIELISQRLFTLKTINDVVDRLDVYPRNNTEDPRPPAMVARRFRRDMEIELVSAETLNARGQEVEIAVAVTLAFVSRDPAIAQRVAQELVELFLNENQRSMTSRTAGVSDLLRTSIDNANKELIRAEAEFADFKVQNEGALPELHQLNLNVINRTEQQLSDANLRLGELEQRKLQLSVQLSSLSPSAPITLPSGETVMSDRERLRALLVDYRRKSAIYQAGHPDLVRLEREINTLRDTVGETATYSLLQEQLRQEQDRLGGLRERYSDDHPDIRNAEAAIAELETQLSGMNPQSLSEEHEIADNPAYVLVSTQLQATNLEIGSLQQKRRELQSIIAEHEALIKQAPIVEMQYEALMRKYQNAKTKHDDLAGKLRAAEVAADVEVGITGRRFEVIEPAALPNEPEERYQSAIFILGLVLAVGIGGGAVVLAEITDKSIRSVNKLVEIAGSPPLAVIPYLSNREDLSHARQQKVLLISGLIAVTILCVGYYLISQGLFQDFVSVVQQVVENMRSLLN